MTKKTWRCKPSRTSTSENVTLKSDFMESNLFQVYLFIHKKATFIFCQGFLKGFKVFYFSFSKLFTFSDYHD